MRKTILSLILVRSLLAQPTRLAVKKRIALKAIGKAVWLKKCDTAFFTSIGYFWLAKEQTA